MATSPLPSRGPKNGRIGHITPAFLGVPNRRGQNQKWPHQPCVPGGRLFGEGGQKQARLGNGEKKMPGALSSSRTIPIGAPLLLGGNLVSQDIPGWKKPTNSNMSRNARVVLCRNRFNHKLNSTSIIIGPPNRPYRPPNRPYRPPNRPPNWPPNRPLIGPPKGHLTGPLIGPLICPLIGPGIEPPIGPVIGPPIGRPPKKAPNRPPSRPPDRPRNRYPNRPPQAGHKALHTCTSWYAHAAKSAVLCIHAQLHVLRFTYDLLSPLACFVDTVCRHNTAHDKSHYHLPIHLAYIGQVDFFL